MTNTNAAEWIEKDWLVKHVTVNTRGGLHIQGENLNHPVGHMDREFAWEISPRYSDMDRFDFSGSTYGPGAQDAVAKWPEVRAAWLAKP